MRPPPAPPLLERAWIAPAGVALLWTLALGGWSPTPQDGIDFVRFYQPYQHLLRESVLRGEIPWWNPYSSLGRPFVADLQVAALYPSTLLVLALGPWAGWIAGTWAHGVVGAEGFRRLARWAGASPPSALGAAAAYLFSGPALARMQEGEINYVYALCFVPWVLWLSAGLGQAPTRRAWAALACVFALQLWCGHPQIFWFSAVGSGLFTSGLLASPPWPAAGLRWVRTELLLVSASLASLGLLGFALLPLLELAAQSNRAQPNLAFSGAFAMGGPQWMSLLWPSGGAFGINWEYNIFTGLTVAAAGLVALCRLREPAMRAAAAMAAGAAILAAGPATVVFSLLYRILPGMSSFRVPARAAALVTVALMLGAAAFAGRPQGGRSRLAVMGLLAAAFAGFVAFALGFAHSAAGLGTQAGLCVVAALGWWLWTGERAPRSGILRVLGRGVLPAALASELILSLHGMKELYVFQTEFPLETVVVGAVRPPGAARSVAPERVCVDSTVFRENAGMIYHVASVVGYESLSLGRVWDYLHRAIGGDPSHPYSTIPDGHIYAAAPGLHAFSLEESLPIGGSELFLDRHPDPRAYLVPRMRVVADSQAAISAMAAGADFHREALVEAPYAGGLRPDADRPAGTSRISGFGLNDVDLEVESPGRALLVVAEAWYPGWRAEVRGVPVACVPVNAWMRGIEVPAGPSHVHLHFHQGGLAAGLLLSAAAALGVGLIGWGGRRPAGPIRPADDPGAP